MKTITRDFNRPRVQVPPGEILLEEFLRPGGLTQVEAARRMKVPLNRLNEIVRGRRAITADTALHMAALEAAASGAGGACVAGAARRVEASPRAGRHRGGCIRPRRHCRGPLRAREGLRTAGSQHAIPQLLAPLRSAALRPALPGLDAPHRPAAVGVEPLPPRRASALHPPVDVGGQRLDNLRQRFVLRAEVVEHSAHFLLGLAVDLVVVVGLEAVTLTSTAINLSPWR